MGTADKVKTAQPEAIKSHFLLLGSMSLQLNSTINSNTIETANVRPGATSGVQPAGVAPGALRFWQDEDTRACLPAGSLHGHPGRLLWTGDHGPRRSWQDPKARCPQPPTRTRAP